MTQPPIPIVIGPTYSEENPLIAAEIRGRSVTKVTLGVHLQRSPSGSLSVDDGSASIAVIIPA